MADEEPDLDHDSEDDPPDPPRKITVDMPSWVPTERVPKGLLIVTMIVLLLAISIGISVPFLTGWLETDDLEPLGIPGIFLANFLGTATVFFPVPGVTAAAQGLIVIGAEKWWDPGVVIAASAGMTLAESTAYLAGVVGRNAAEERDVQLKGRLGRVVRKVTTGIDWLMARYGFLTLLTLSAIPNPFFEFAGITAGAVRMNFWKFLVAVGIGKTTRVILIVIIGQALIDFFEL
jgi:membrane protein YqaA with SNARE-associated domain